MRSIKYEEEDVVTVSPKYQVVVPKKVRQKLGIRKGDKMEVKTVNNRIVLKPIPSVESLIGTMPELAKGETIKQIRREADERLDRL